jgi:hypothetical protein
MDPNNRLLKNDPSAPIHEMMIDGIRVSYSSLIGSAMYAMLGTHPELAYAVGVLGRFSSNPGNSHWAAAKRVLRYLQHAKELCLTFDGNARGDMRFIGYSDSSWSDNTNTSQSTSGYIFIIGGGAIGWSSKRQNLVALSSTEAEYIGLSNAGQQLCWLRTFFEDIGYSQEIPTTLFCNNQGAIILTKDPEYRTKTKHIQWKYHYIRDDVVAKGQAIIQYIPTDDMVADIFTKPLSLEKFEKFSHALGLRFRSSGSVKM